MGIDIGMSVGVGVHIPEDVYMKWVEDNDGEDEYGRWDMAENLIYGRNGYPELTFDFPDNSWEGAQNGIVFFARASSWDMGREAEAGVYRPNAGAITLKAREQLNAVSKLIAGKELPIESLVTVSVT